MILRKRFDCTVKDLDSVIVAVAKEIEDGLVENVLERLFGELAETISMVNGGGRD